MTKVENHCVDCGLPCLYDNCPFRNVEVYYCDSCHKQIDGAVYHVDGKDMCKDCFVEEFKENVSDFFDDYEKEILDWMDAEKEMV